ncbi:hypothetical protein DKX38_015424 [Salix brachista]|uniref:Reverse transcriptase Ty1/copia-type domain-containing protein n=1 Tax=Salix brachista TaxID=2182728 RepID=A0A5N5L6Z9_9ROSI|nr:hypothetical protein DKX38_015424 [Salix brachista]
MSKFDGDPLPDVSLCRHIVGALQYCTLTRPDIAFSVNQLYQDKLMIRTLPMSLRGAVTSTTPDTTNVVHEDDTADVMQWDTLSSSNYAANVMHGDNSVIP